VTLGPEHSLTLRRGIEHNNNLITDIIDIIMDMVKVISTLAVVEVEFTMTETGGGPIAVPPNRQRSEHLFPNPTSVV
jgi:hypothetical protein